MPSIDIDESKAVYTLRTKLHAFGPDEDGDVVFELAEPDSYRRDVYLDEDGQRRLRDFLNEALDEGKPEEPSIDFTLNWSKVVKPLFEGLKREFDYETIVAESRKAVEEALAGIAIKEEKNSAPTFGFGVGTPSPGVDPDVWNKAAARVALDTGKMLAFTYRKPSPTNSGETEPSFRLIRVTKFNDSYVCGREYGDTTEKTFLLRRIQGYAEAR